MSTLSLPSPVAPNSRSRSAGRPGRGESGDRTGARSPLPSTPRLLSSRSTRPEGYLPPSRDKLDTTRTNSSSTSPSTSGSSFLDRMKAPSSRTSLEDNQSELPRRGGGGWAPSRGKRAVQVEDEHSDEEDLRQGPGADLWSRVTAVASKLTVNVNQAWQKSVLADGEETPPGEESRLTKAMKAYHLGRARSAGDLPPWLFTERERGVGPNAWNGSNQKEYEDRFLPDRDLDVYDQGAASSSALPARGGSRAGNRLKAIRDAQRSAKIASEPAQSRSEVRYQDMTASRSGDVEASGPWRSSPRVGLPAGPGKMRRQ